MYVFTYLALLAKCEQDIGLIMHIRVLVKILDMWQSLNPNCKRLCLLYQPNTLFIHPFAFLIVVDLYCTILCNKYTNIE